MKEIEEKSKLMDT